MSVACVAWKDSIYSFLDRFRRIRYGAPFSSLRPSVLASWCAALPRLDAPRERPPTHHHEGAFAGARSPSDLASSAGSIPPV